MPIFANYKKKRLRQALFASPTTTRTDQTEDYGDFATEMNGFCIGDECFEANETGPQKESFALPQTSNSLNKGRNINESLPSTRQSHYLLDGHGKSGNSSSACRGSYTGIGNNRSEVQVRRPVKQENSNNVDTLLRPYSASINYNEARFVSQFCFVFSSFCQALILGVSPVGMVYFMG